MQITIHVSFPKNKDRRNTRQRQKYPKRPDGTDQSLKRQTYLHICPINILHLSRNSIALKKNLNTKMELFTYQYQCHYQIHLVLFP